MVGQSVTAASEASILVPRPGAAAIAGKRGLLFLIIFACAAMAMGGPAASQAKEIAVIWSTPSQMPKNVVMGFLPAIRKLAPDLKVSLYRDLKDDEEAERVFRECEPKVDGIVFLRSNGAQFLGTVKPKVPCFVGACNDPVVLGALKNPNAPEGMVTGVTYALPYEKKFEIIKTLFPNVKSLALLLEKGHAGAPIDAAGTKAQCRRLGIAYKEVVASNLKELIDEAKALGKVDLIVIGNNRLVMDNVTALLAVANPNKTPMFSYADRPVKAGAVAGVAADDMKLGAMLAQSVYDVVEKGKPISQTPVKTDPAPMISVNEKMMIGLGLKFPDSVLADAKIIK